MSGGRGPGNRADSGARSLCGFFYYGKNMAWKQFYSETIGCKIAVNADTGIVRTEDGVQYSRAESDLFTRHGDKSTAQIHAVKKLIPCEIVGGDDKEEQSETGRT
jgi:hypothetical protein